MRRIGIIGLVVLAGLASAAPRLKPEKPAADWVAELAAAPPEDLPWVKVTGPFGRLPPAERGKAALRLYDLLTERARAGSYPPPRDTIFELVLQGLMRADDLSQGNVHSLLLVFKWYEAHNGKPPGHLCTKEFKETGKTAK